MGAKALQSLANRIVDDIPRAELKAVAANGYQGELPGGLDEDDRADLLEVIQNTALCVASGAMWL